MKDATKDKLKMIGLWILIIGLVVFFWKGLENCAMESRKARAVRIERLADKDMILYHAWCKADGNSGNLTFGEWQALRKQKLLPGQPEDDNVGACFIRTARRGAL